MKPAATEIDWKSKWVCDRPCAPAKTWARFDNETFYAGSIQPPACRDSSRAATDDHGLDVTGRHLQRSSSDVGGNNRM
jgi:hypothetical protein